MFSRFTLPVRFALLVAGTMLPLLIFSGGIISSNYLKDQRDAQDRVLGFTRSIRDVLDREMQGIVSGLSVLASSPALRDGDFETFRIGARAFTNQFDGDPLILVADEQGHVVFSSARGPGAALPDRTARPERGVVFATGKPAFSPLFVGAVSKRQIVTVTVPVYRDGKVVYDLSFNPPLDIFQRIIEQQSPGERWTISIFDQTGMNFARLPHPETTIGLRASPTLYNVMLTRPEGEARTVSLEGEPLITAFSRSQLSGWIAAAGIAEKSLTAPAARNFMLAAAVGGLMLLIGLAFALRMATQLVRAEALHELLINELNHRVKNTLATVQSLAAQTFRGVADPEPRRKFDARLAALGRTHDLLSEEKWAGADMREVVEGVLAPFQSSTGRISASGPALRLSTRTVVVLAMVIHELATNAAKYGALSQAGGTVTITWSEVDNPAERRMRLLWQERGGPQVGKPQRAGFGSTLIEQGMKGQLDGNARLRFEPDGVICEIEWPLR
jgi:two-component sensor histidine kinase